MADDLIVTLRNTTLPTIEPEVRSAELACSLKALATDQGKNYAVFKRDGSFPSGGVTILAWPATPPGGGAKICDGHLLLGGQPTKVSAFRA